VSGTAVAVDGQPTAPIAKPLTLPGVAAGGAPFIVADKENLDEDRNG
jgi:hypothetical protein